MWNRLRTDSDRKWERESEPDVAWWIVVLYTAQGILGNRLFVVSYLVKTWSLVFFYLHNGSPDRNGSIQSLTTRTLGALGLILLVICLCFPAFYFVVLSCLFTGLAMAHIACARKPTSWHWLCYYSLTETDQRIQSIIVKEEVTFLILLCQSWH